LQSHVPNKICAKSKFFGIWNVCIADTGRKQGARKRIPVTPFGRLEVEDFAKQLPRQRCEQKTI
jgi:broad specificity phosphatase PhoE